MSKDSQKSSGQTTTKKFTPMELENALQYAEGVLEGLRCQFFLMDELGKFVNEHTADDWFDDTIDTISLGVRKLEVTDSIPRNLITIVPNIVMIPGEWQFEKFGVPIRVTIVERKYHFLQNLDTKMHLSSEYKIPNPFNKYWQSRYLVK